MKKQLLITFDYELFLGPRSGQAEACLLQPTRVLLDILRPYGVKAVFFVDTTYLCTLEKFAQKYEACKKDLDAVSKQIQDIIKAGHYVFPHLHPHWLDAQYIPEKHEFVLTNVARYRFHNLTMEDRELVFTESMRIIEKIIQEVKPNYIMNGYRAGGWSIQPFIDLKPFFDRYKISYDFSVMRGSYQFSNAQYFDFSDAPSKPVYRFNEDIVKEDNEGPFTQLTGSVIKIKSYIKLMDKIHRKLLYKFVKDHTYGKGIGQQSKMLKDLQPRSLNGFPTKDQKHEYIAVELLSVVKLQSYLEYFREEDYMHFVSHPKMLSNHNLYILDKFLEMVFHDYTIETDFIKIAESYQKNTIKNIQQ